MPHLVLEHSAELTGSHDLHAAARALFDAAHEGDLFTNKAAIKVRTVACDNVLMGTNPQTFAHLTIYLLSGRTDAARADLATRMLAVLDQQFPDVGALSVDPRDINTQTYAKRVI